MQYDFANTDSGDFIGKGSEVQLLASCYSAEHAGKNSDPLMSSDILCSQSAIIFLIRKPEGCPFYKARAESACASIAPTIACSFRSRPFTE